MYRKHIRLKEFDYSSSNWYFVTVCTDYRKKVFAPRVSEKYSGSVVAGLVPANSSLAATRAATTYMVETILTQEIPKKYSAHIDFYVFMNNHIHFIIILSGDHKGRNYTLGQIVGAFKSLSTRALWKIGLKGKLFQPNFYEHVIRNEQSLEKIRQYILNNPIVEHQKIPWKLIDPIV